MKKNAMRKNLLQSIRKSFGRYIAIAAIIALGSGLFLGLLMTKTDMVATGQVFTDEQNMFDLRVLGTYGWTEEYVEAFSQLEGISGAEGIVSMDLIARKGDSGEDSVYRFLSMPTSINQVALRGGRMPEAANECLAGGYRFGDEDLGTVIYLSQDNDEDSLEDMNYTSFTIVGYVSTPLYMDMNRGTTSVGSGNLADFFYIPVDAFNVDYYTEIDLTIPGDYDIYSDSYNDALEAAADALEPEAEKLNSQRFQDVKEEAEEEYNDAYQEYLDGVEEYEDGKAEAEQELADAEQELLDAEQELKDSYQELVDGGREIEEGREQIEDARAQITSGREQVASGREQLAAAKAQAETEIAAARAQLDASAAQLQPYYEQAIQNKATVEGAISQINAQISALDPEAEGYQEQLTALQQQLSGYETTLSQINSTIDSWNTIQSGYAELSAQEQTLKDTEAQLDATEAQLDAAEQQMWAGETQLNEAYDTLMSGWTKYHEGEEELADGWEEYEEAKADAEKELADAKAELDDAKAELDDARKEIDDMEEPDLYILDRNSNVGFTNLESNSDIVEGVSRVFPVFFLLVASLVCITTMTRMIDEERTQIGTLKALGYSNAAIISKYMLYSGTSAILGCALGILFGCTVFPMIVWQAYCIMLYIQPNVVLTVNWPLCLTIVAVYLAVMLSVTWYSCHRTLEEEPSELIRPKAPDPGKKIFLEYLPIWKRVSFLNKVTIRNIFRYRQRLAMMLVGIGGCTALLVTGFGLRDSIVNIMDFQFDDVTHYDLSVYFREENTAKELREFQEALDGGAEEYMLYHQSNVELDFNDQVKEIYMLSAGDQVKDFITMRSGSQEVAMPGKNEAVLTIGVANSMGVDVGDSITLRNSDMETLELTVSGIYDNYVYNYAIVLPETIEEQWGVVPEEQMAFVKTAEGGDSYALSAKLSGLDNVMTVSISEDVATIVRGMMDALDLVVWVILFCAGLLAVTVLYNLTNININERIREIATIKVLGFNSAETSAYVFKENLALTVAGTILGLGMGKLLLNFVMSQVKIDMVWFKAVAEPSSYLLSIALTLLSALVVNLVFGRKLERINMAEALKSVE